MCAGCWREEGVAGREDGEGRHGDAQSPQHRGCAPPLRASRRPHAGSFPRAQGPAAALPRHFSHTRIHPCAQEPPNRSHSLFQRPTCTDCDGAQQHGRHHNAACAAAAGPGRGGPEDSAGDGQPRCGCRASCRAACSAHPPCSRVCGAMMHAWNAAQWRSCAGALVVFVTGCVPRAPRTAAGPHPISMPARVPGARPWPRGLRVQLAQVAAAARRRSPCTAAASFRSHTRPSPPSWPQLPWACTASR